MKFKEIMDKISKDVLTEETKTQIMTVFEQTVNEKVTERIKLEVETELKKLDEEHSSKLEKLLEAIDTDHTRKLESVVKKIDEDHTAKLQQVVEQYEASRKEEAASFHGALVNEISNYIELYIDKTIPSTQIAEAVQNQQAKRMINAIKKIVAVDESYITDNVKEALEDGRNQIDTLRGELNETIKENIKVQQELKGTKAELILEKKTVHMPKEKKEFVMRVLKDKSPEYITENLNFVLEMFNRDEKDQVKILTEQAKKEAVTKNIDTPKSEIKSIESDEVRADSINEYLNEMKKFDR